MQYPVQTGSWPLTQPGNAIADESRRSVPGESRRCNIRCESGVGRRCSQRMSGRRKPKVQPLSQPEKSGSGASWKLTNWREPENAEPDESRERVLRGEPKHAMSDASRATNDGAARGAATGASWELNSVETRGCRFRRKPEVGLTGGNQRMRQPAQAGSWVTGKSRKMQYPTRVGSWSTVQPGEATAGANRRSAAGKTRGNGTRCESGDGSLARAERLNNR